MNTFFKPNNNDIDQQQDTRYQCRHIRTSGHRCLCPALRGEKFCYYHHTNRPAVPKAEAQRRKSKRGTFSIALPEDRTSIQHNLGSIMQRLAVNDIDLKRAGLLLYALQIASANLPKEDPRKKPQATVDEITHDPELGIIAPETSYTNAEPPTASETILLEWNRLGAAVRARNAQGDLAPNPPTNPAEQESTIIPSLEASVPPLPTPTLTSIRSGLCDKTSQGVLVCHPRMRKFLMSNFIPQKPTGIKVGGLSPKAQKLQALREKAAAAAQGATGGKLTPGAAAPQFKATSAPARKANFQRKAT